MRTPMVLSTGAVLFVGAAVVLSTGPVAVLSIGGHQE
jgi:hypothetical protein